MLKLISKFEDSALHHNKT